jgi:hypothetical protein
VAHSLSELGLAAGDRVRFRRTGGQRWSSATVEGRERDGSIALRDENGASRSIRVEHVEVFRASRKGGQWQAVVRRSWEQLALFGREFGEPAGRDRRGRRR